ncbi:DUF2059 domain-containing protein [Pinirhizobacter sp.]|jgi:hypothetical protein|uniref:DUF2059 domain-containing protein n=1 Tax=Pinirhizobacter sp. TaxID=2950432 RepID=UPI002F402C47
MRAVLRLIPGFALAVLSLAAPGAPVAAPAPVVSGAPATATQVHDLIVLMGVPQSLNDMNQQMAAAMKGHRPCIDDQVWSGFINDGNRQELLDAMIPAYQKHFTGEEIDGLLKFYRSPLGQKVISQMPEVFAENVKVTREWGEKRRDQLVGELKAKGQLDADGQCPGTREKPGMIPPEVASGPEPARKASSHKKSTKKSSSKAPAKSTAKPAAKTPAKAPAKAPAKKPVKKTGSSGSTTPASST